jgi:hypothetical protein
MGTILFRIDEKVSDGSFCHVSAGIGIVWCRKYEIHKSTTLDANWKSEFLPHYACDNNAEIVG